MQVGPLSSLSPRCPAHETGSDCIRELGQAAVTRFQKEEREQCAALGCACQKCSEGPTELLVAQQAERRVGGDPCGSMGNGAEARVLGVLKAIHAFHSKHNNCGELMETEARKACPVET